MILKPRLGQNRTGTCGNVHKNTVEYSTVNPLKKLLLLLLLAASKTSLLLNCYLSFPKNYWAMQKTDSGKFLKGSVIFQFYFPLTHFRDYWGSRKINQSNNYLKT